jgi:hypothetical protein
MRFQAGYTSLGTLSSPTFSKAFYPADESDIPLVPPDGWITCSYMSFLSYIKAVVDRLCLWGPPLPSPLSVFLKSSNGFLVF